ncbi:lipopolysaccharide biosynthesis protein [Parabacteroides distasonis]|uniref:Lipopolysaccharide biosynthesis protein n=2 Tax=Parabacteroides distasonis TaxID=823 RepID=A0A3L7ZSQ5_PARDI|nr:lipopolysaccharide biosynthesis protein [Parabacteroides distasonis]
MVSSHLGNNRIIKNTILLYFRMILLILVQLYIVPVILRNLGVADYGLYNVIAGVVTMFSFLGGSLSSGIQRFMSFAIGKNDKELLNTTFGVTASIFIVFSFVTFLLLESFGSWFVNCGMNIPAERIVAANWVFQFSVLSFIVNLVTIPYNSAIIAHERMSIYAYASIFDGVLKFLLAISLSFFSFDKLIYYAGFIVVISVSICLFYIYYCKRNFEECRDIKLTWNPEIGRKLLFYSGWNVVGVLANIGRGQGLNIVMNLFFGTLLNAAHAIALQINGVVSQFISNIYMATRPPITKLYAQGDIGGMWNLIFRSAKITFYLLMILSIPAIIEIETVLSLWLRDVPEYTSNIVVLMLMMTLIETLVNQLISAFQAANRIKRYQQYSSTIILLCVPLSFVVLKFWKMNPMIPYVISIALSFFYVLSIVVVAKMELNMSMKKFLHSVLIRNVIVFVIVFVLVRVLSDLLDASFGRVVVTFLLTLLSSAIMIWIVGLDGVEKAYVSNQISKVITNIKNNRIHEKS